MDWMLGYSAFLSRQRIKKVSSTLILLLFGETQMRLYTVLFHMGRVVLAHWDGIIEWFCFFFVSCNHFTWRQRLIPPFSFSPQGSYPVVILPLLSTCGILSPSYVVWVYQLLQSKIWLSYWHLMEQLLVRRLWYLAYLISSIVAWHVTHIFSTCAGRVPLAAFGLVMATHLSLYPAILTIPVCLIFVIYVFLEVNRL